MMATPPPTEGGIRGGSPIGDLFPHFWGLPCQRKSNSVFAKWRLVAFALSSACFSPGATAEVGRVVGGVHFAEAIPGLDYERRHDPANRTGTLVEGNEQWRAKTHPWLEASYRVADQIGVELHLFRLEVPADALVRRTVHFLFLPLRIGVRVPVQIESESARISIGWLIPDGPWDGSAVWAGIQGMRISASYALPGGESRQESVAAPLPALGATLRYRMTETLAVMARGSYSPAYGKAVEGDATESAAAVEWHVFGKALLGVGYRDYRFRINLNRADYQAEASLKARGPLIYAGWSF